MLLVMVEKNRIELYSNVIDSISIYFIYLFYSYSYSPNAMHTINRTPRSLPPSKKKTEKFKPSLQHPPLIRLFRADALRDLTEGVFDGVF